MLLSVDEKDYQIFDTDMRFEKFRILIENFGENIYIQKKLRIDLMKIFSQIKKFYLKS